MPAIPCPHLLPLPGGMDLILNEILRRRGESLKWGMGESQVGGVDNLILKVAYGMMNQEIYNRHVVLYVCLFQYPQIERGEKDEVLVCDAPARCVAHE